VWGKYKKVWGKQKKVWGMGEVKCGVITVAVIKVWGIFKMPF